MERLNLTAQRLCIPPLDPELALKSLVTLVGVERDWVPSHGGDVALHPADHHRQRAVPRRAAGEVVPLLRDPLAGGRLLPRGDQPREDHGDRQLRARRARAGWASAKTASTTRPASTRPKRPSTRASPRCCGSTASQRKYIEEVGTMNIMLQIGDEVITPPLAGTILAGVTRDSALTLMREWGLRVVRAADHDRRGRRAAARKGTLKEVWGTGTAAVISPVGELAYKGERHRDQRRAGSASSPSGSTTRSWASSTGRRPIPTAGRWRSRGRIDERLRVLQDPRRADPSMKIYEDERTLCIMDINPLNAGPLPRADQDARRHDLRRRRGRSAGRDRHGQARRHGAAGGGQAGRAQHAPGQRRRRLPVGAALPPAPDPALDQRRQGLRLEARPRRPAPHHGQSAKAPRRRLRG